MSIDYQGKLFWRRPKNGKFFVYTCDTLFQLVLLGQATWRYSFLVWGAKMWQFRTLLLDWVVFTTLQHSHILKITYILMSKYILYLTNTPKQSCDFLHPTKAEPFEPKQISRFNRNFYHHKSLANRGHNLVIFKIRGISFYPFLSPFLSLSSHHFHQCYGNWDGKRYPA